jgi:hypothetical protein
MAHLVNGMPGRRNPVQARAARARLRRLAALTGLRRPGCLASKRVMALRERDRSDRD